MEYPENLLSKTFKKNFSEKNLEKKLSKLPGRVTDMLKHNLDGVPIQEVCEAYDFGHPSSRKQVVNRVAQNKKVFDARDRLRAKLAAKKADSNQM